MEDASRTVTTQRGHTIALAIVDGCWRVMAKTAQVCVELIHALRYITFEVHMQTSMSVPAITEDASTTVATQMGPITALVIVVGFYQVMARTAQVATVQL